MRATRERVLDAAVRLTAAEGWAGVTMGRLAQEVGVSRQTVYNEVGSKPGLAEALVARELELFLGLVAAAFDAHPGDLVAGVRAAAHAVLAQAEHDPLLRSVVSATHGADTELLPLLTTHSAALLDAARAAVLERVVGYEVGLPADRLEAGVDVVVRVVLSHVMQPVGEPARTAADVAWVAERLLAEPAG